MRPSRRRSGSPGRKAIAMSNLQAALAGTGELPAGPFYGTFLDYWPAAVEQLSIPHVAHELNHQDIGLLEHFETASGLMPRQDCYSDTLTAFLSGAVQAFPDGVFFRLGGRSFVTAERGAQRCRTVADALRVLSAPGYRAARMARRCRLAGRPVWLFARQWIDMQPWGEFRLLFRDRELVGATQFHPHSVWPQLEPRLDDIATALSAFAARLASELHLPDVVADVYWPLDTSASCVLIELNPFLSITGLGLFASWDDATRRRLRIRGRDGECVECRL